MDMELDRSSCRTVRSVEQWVKSIEKYKIRKQTLFKTHHTGFS